MNTPHITCFGEVLWDLLPGRKVIGGAPLNVAYHAARLGATSELISRIGDDEYGNAIKAFLTDNGIGNVLITKHPELPTGTVKVTFQNQESPVYEIVEGVAWDHIKTPVEAASSLTEADALVFGSLACRSPQNLKVLKELAGLPQAMVFDVNLRSPFYSRELTMELLDLADIIKLNEEELQLVSAWHNFDGTQTDQLKQARSHYKCRALVLTMGAEGAMCVDDSGLHQHPGYPVKVADSIGAGDTFLAGFLTRYLAGEPSNKALDFAAAAGALTASKTGGTPGYTLKEVQSIQNMKSAKKYQS